MGMTWLPGRVARSWIVVFNGTFFVSVPVQVTVVPDFLTSESVLVMSIISKADGIWNVTSLTSSSPLWMFSSTKLRLMASPISSPDELYNGVILRELFCTFIVILLVRLCDSTPSK